MNKYIKLLVVSSFILVSYAASGFELSANLYSDVSYHSNVALQSDSAEEDVSQTFGLLVQLEENRKRFNADASFNLTEEHYYNDTFANQTSLTTGFGVFNFDIIENFLNWRTSYTRTQVLQNAFDADTPDNREDRDILRSGPSISYRLSRESSVSLSANYTNVENSDIQASDTERVNGAINYNYLLNSTTSFSLSSQYDEMIDGEGADELKSTDVSIGFVRQISHGELSFNFGRTLTRSDISDDVEGDFYDLSFSRREILFHDVVIQYRQDLTDTSIGFESDEEGFETGLGAESNEQFVGVATTLDILNRKRLNLRLSRGINTFQYTFSGFWGDDDFRIQSQDSHTSGFGLSLNQNLTHDITAGLTYRFTFDDFFEQSEIGKEKRAIYRFDLSYRFSPDLVVKGDVGFNSRENSQNKIREYEDFGVNLGFDWTIY